MSRPVIALDARLIGGASTGDSTYWTGLLYGLAAVEHEFRFLLMSNAEKPSEIPLSDNFEWVTVPAKSSRMWSYAKFPRAALSAGAQVIHTQYSLSPLAAGRGVTTVHDVSFFIEPSWFRWKDRLLLSRSVPAAVRRAAKVITVSETSRSEVERYIPAAKGKVSVTYPAAHPQIKAVPRGEAIQRVRAELGIAGPFILTVGTRWPRKNMNLAVDAVAALPASIPHKLVITGKSGWGEETASGRVVASGYVTVDQLSALYSAADLYLAPSFHEGFGITLVEAFTCACPVLCSAGGAMPEVAGGAAEIEGSWDANVWSERIQELLADSSKLDDLRRKGSERAKEFTWQKTALKTLEVYREVASH
jgi:glycosyltransferase involved in cell wall biosynthesis